MFSWQHFSSRVIFFVVLGLVFLGMTLAWLQFRTDRSDQAPNGKRSLAHHNIEISKTGIKVSSPVLGVVILALSLGFFYLYLAFVYPITEIF